MSVFGEVLVRGYDLDLVAGSAEEGRAATTWIHRVTSRDIFILFKV
jgi:hypothetical protein